MKWIIAAVIAYLLTHRDGHKHVVQWWVGE